LKNEFSIAHVDLFMQTGNHNQYNNCGAGNNGRPGSLQQMLMPMSPNLPSPVLSPSFWPPTPFSTPFCSPNVPNCGMGTHLGDPVGLPMHSMPPSPNTQGRYKSYNNSNNMNTFGFPSTVNPNPKMNYLKSQMTLPLTESLNTQQQINSLSSCTSSLSMYSIGEESPVPPLSVPTPNSGNGYPTFKDRNVINQMRKAPGWERSNTYPNLLAQTGPSKPASLTSTGGTPSDSNDGGTSGSSSSNISPTPGSHPPPGFSSYEKNDSATSGNVNETSGGNINPMTEKKYMAVQGICSII